MESVSGSIWCELTCVSEIDSWFVAQCRDIIWSWKMPILSSFPSFFHNYAQYHFTLDHNGDIKDEECLTLILIKMSKQFNVAFKIQTGEGDFIMFETAQYIPEEIEIPEEVSVVYQGKLYHILDTVSNSPNLPDLLSDKEALFPQEVQNAFQTFVSNIEKLDLYHTKTLLIPKGLKRLFLYDQSLIAKVVPKAHFSKSYNTDFVFEEHRVKFRKHHFVLLDSMEIRVPREFCELCDGKQLRYIKFSYLLTIAFQDILKDKELEEEIQNSQSSDMDSVVEKDNDDMKNNTFEDDDEKWIDEATKPEFSYEDIGDAMAERVGEFMHEISEFDSIEADGPINFDFDSFKNKLENFLDSSDDAGEEEEEEECEDQLIDQLQDEDEKILRCVGSGKAPVEPFVNSFLSQSYNSQPTENGPTSDFMQLFNLK